MSTAAQQPHALSCLEVWGGNQHVSALLELPGLLAWVESAPYKEATEGGDVHYLSACNNGVVARIALADVSGHGAEVGGIAENLRKLMREYVNYWDQTEFVQRLNDAFPKDSSGVKYASAVILGYYRGSGELLFTNAGHLPPLWYRAASNEWDFLKEDSPAVKNSIEGLPLGLVPRTEYQQTAVQLQPGDLVVLYTDGVSESFNGEEQELGLQGLLALAKDVPVHSPAAAGFSLLAAVDQFRAGEPRRDDATVVVLQRQAS
jgi:sigma-B regulation protein RsbU (phosphoserine phosphatase)